jgi:hypothetical protein
MRVAFRARIAACELLRVAAMSPINRRPLGRKSL